MTTNFDLKKFIKLMETLATSWNNNDAQSAVNCFSPNAVYIEPPDKQLILGHAQLFEYFGGDEPKPMKMVWHNLLFNQETQTGAGEFTFGIKNKNHGMVLVELEDGKIKLWREYYKDSNLNFKEFISPENKTFEYTLS